MFKSTPLPTRPTANDNQEVENLPTGHLLINSADKIIFANKQARHILGLLAEESLPNEETFLSLAQSSYNCFPAMAWMGWPKRPSTTISRYLIFTAANGTTICFRVETLEHLIIDSNECWVVAIELVDSAPETAVPQPLFA